MERLVDDMVRLQEDVKSRVSITSTQLAEFKLNRASDTARDSRERAMFVVENSLNVNRMLKEFHDSRIANGQQDRADRIAFVSDMVKKRAEFVEQLSATRKGLLKQITNESAALIADTAVSVAALVKQGKRHANGFESASQAASKQREPVINAGVAASKTDAELLNTWKAAAPAAPKVAAPVARKATAPVAPKPAAPKPTAPVAPVAPKVTASAAPKTTASATPRAGALATPKSAASKAGALATPKSATPKATASAAPKAGALATPKAANPKATVTPNSHKSVKSKRNR
tara:strand:+ start:149 stop:1015 length:867 start_codon:yes stop_codon:yes gene_type:complete